MLEYLNFVQAILDRILLMPAVVDDGARVVSLLLCRKVEENRVGTRSAQLHVTSGGRFKQRWS